MLKDEDVSYWCVPELRFLDEHILDLAQYFRTFLCLSFHILLVMVGILLTIQELQIPDCTEHVLSRVLRCDTHGVLALADQSFFVIVPLWSHCNQFKGVGPGTELAVCRLHFTTCTACQVDTTNRILHKTAHTFNNLSIFLICQTSITDEIPFYFVYLAFFIIRISPIGDAVS